MGQRRLWRGRRPDHGPDGLLAGHHWFALETSDPDGSLFSGSILEDPALLKGAGLALVITIAAVEVGLLNRILATVGLTIDQGLVSIVVSLAVPVVAEGANLLRVGTEAQTEPGAVPAVA